MRTKQEIADFISMCAEKYDIPMVCYIRNEEKFNASGYKWEAMELFENDYDFEMNIKKLAGLFGCNEESLLNADKNAVLDIYEKYPYFKLYHQWEEVNPEERHRVDIKQEDMADIKNKIVEKIQQINDTDWIKMPGNLCRQRIFGHFAHRRSVFYATEIYTKKIVANYKQRLIGTI